MNGWAEKGMSPMGWSQLLVGYTGANFMSKEQRSW